MSKDFARREFLKQMGAGTGALGMVSAGALMPALRPEVNPLFQQEVDWEKIDRDHEEKIITFKDNIGKDDNFWRKPLDYTLDGEVKVFELTTSNVQWETEPGKVFPAFAYNGMTPGPEIRVTEGDHVRFVVKNSMNQSTSIHWHGLDVPNEQDGVPYVTQQPIKPDETFIYEFIVPNAGSHMYHAHHNSLEQVVGGLLGAFIVEPKDKRDEPIFDRDYTMILNDTFLGFTINGKSFPYTQPVIAKVGERVRIRYMNEGLMIHPMHLHGQPQRVFAKDGYNLPAPYLVDTLLVAPGERYDVLVEARAPGIWAFHCHILSHVDAPTGMFGMVTPFVVQE